MAAQEYMLLSKAFTLVRFTAAELASAAGANSNTVGSWLRRHQDYLEPAGTARVRSAAGRPQRVWRLRPEAAIKIRAELDRLYPDVLREADGDLRASGHLERLDRAEQHVAAWREAARRNDLAAHEALVTARSWVRITWEKFAELDRLNVAVPERELGNLAMLEREIGGGDLPIEKPLPLLIRWFFERTNQMAELGARDGFAARVMRCRANLRSPATAATLTAAALGAAVWWDEGLGTGLTGQAVLLGRCRRYIDLVPPNQLPIELTSALDPGEFRRHPEQRQAVVTGLVSTPDLVSEPIFHWLSYLPLALQWTPELAPPVMQGLLRAGTRLDAALRTLTASLTAAIDMRWDDVSWTDNWGPGSRRSHVISHARRVLQYNQRREGLSPKITAIEQAADHDDEIPLLSPHEISASLGAGLGREIVA